MRTAFRAGLALVGAAQAELALWGLIAPHSLYSDYPGFGRHWISALGPFNEHLIRDYAAAELGFAVLLVCMAIWFERRLVLVGGAAFLAATVPHFAYHLATTDHLPAADNAASLTAFAVEIAVVAGAMVISTRPSEGRLHVPATAS